MKLKFSRQIFEKYSNIKFHENPSSWGRVIPCGRTEMTKAISRFSKFYESALKMGGVKDFIARDHTEGTDSVPLEGTHSVPLPIAHHITHKMT
jgi:hypothetical protein